MNISDLKKDANQGCTVEVPVYRAKRAGPNWIMKGDLFIVIWHGKRAMMRSVFTDGPASMWRLDSPTAKIISGILEPAGLMKIELHGKARSMANTILDKCRVTGHK